MKAVADTLAVARSNLIERMSRRAKSRKPYRKAGDDELLALIHRLVDERPSYSTLGTAAPRPTSARRLRASSRIRWQNLDSLRALCGRPWSVYSPRIRRRCSSRISSAMLVRDSRTSSANGAFGRQPLHDSAGIRLSQICNLAVEI